MNTETTNVSTQRLRELGVLSSKWDIYHTHPCPEGLGTCVEERKERSGEPEMVDDCLQRNSFSRHKMQGKHMHPQPLGECIEGLRKLR